VSTPREQVCWSVIPASRGLIRVLRDAFFRARTNNGDGNSTMASGEPVHLVDARGPCRVSTPLLVVEYDPHVRCMLELLLEEEGYPVVGVADGLDALRRLQEGRPCLVILDFHLPYVNGDEVGARIRARYGRALPIILVSANPQGAAVAEVLDAAYLQKPFNVDELLSVVRRCLGQN
jgi:CheY-like chemotaxis protein